MNKLQFWIIFILALILMFLSSCRTPKAETCEATDSIAMRTIALRDSTHRISHLDFEQMDICFSQFADSMPHMQYRPSGAHVKHIRIMRGSLSDSAMRTSGRTEVRTDCASSTMRSVPVFPPTKPTVPLLVLATLLILLLAVVAMCRGQP